MLQMTPVLVGSFFTVAVKAWLPLMGTLAVGGLTVTEIDAIGPGESVLQAATSSTPITDRVFISTMVPSD
jgi:hypothetical protein